uniref:Ig-like domain-containing protein n=1 Tax=Oryzias latipes TaxID=8090 RepID=A0A3P9KFK3_ORYLA
MMGRATLLLKRRKEALLFSLSVLLTHLMTILITNNLLITDNLIIHLPLRFFYYQTRLVSPVWKKEGKVLKAGPKYELLHTGKSLGLIIKDVTKDDAGEYSCDLGTELVLLTLEIGIGITKWLKSTEVNEGETCSFECILSRESTDDFLWTINGKTVANDGQLLKPGEKYDMKQKATSCEIQIKSLTVEDSGEYSCVVGDQKTFATLKVTGMHSFFILPL